MNDVANQHGMIDRRTFLRLGLFGAVAGWLARPAAAASANSMAPRSVIDALSTQIGVIRRSAWARAPIHLARLRAADPYTRITLHHTGTQVLRATTPHLVAQEISNVQGAHLSQHYGDIAYHLIVDYAGRVWEGRSLAYEGAHTLNGNEGNIGVMLLGNFEKQDPSAAQLATQANLVALLRRQYRIRASHVYGHRDLSPTVCPGGRLYPYVTQLRHA